MSDIRDEDLALYAWPPRPGGGGQHVTRCGSGVAIVHKPTGIAAVSVDERSQLANRTTALRRLRDLVQREAELARIRPVYEAACAVADGSESGAALFAAVDKSRKP